MEPTETSEAPFVLIVDDEPDIRDIYEKKFKTEGFRTATACDGAEGLKAIRADRPDIVLLDLQMPVLDGHGVLRELRADPVLSDIPVIILSNVNDERMFSETEALPVSCYLVKSLTTPQTAVIETKKTLSRRQS